MPNSVQPSLPAVSIVVPAGHGCHHAEAVLSAIRSQMDSKDELIVLELIPCNQAVSTDEEKHQVIESGNESTMKVLGLATSTSDVLLVLEDHGVPGEGFLDALKHLFACNESIEGVSFLYENGTDENASSRAAYLYVAGLSDIGSKSGTPNLIASAFALSGDTLKAVRSRAQLGQLPPGELEYVVCPEVCNQGLMELPRALTIKHFQDNSLAQAMAANYWNARIAGWKERPAWSLGSSVHMSAHRYFGRVIRLSQLHKQARRVIPQLSLIGSAAFIGWWSGRYFGVGEAHTRMWDAHPDPAGLDAA